MRKMRPRLKVSLMKRTEVVLLLRVDLSYWKTLLIKKQWMMLRICKKICRKVCTRSSRLVMWLSWT